MSKSAYGFNFAQTIDRNIPGNFFIEIGRTLRLYYSKNYIDKDKMRQCLYLSDKLGNPNPKEKCLEENNINQIITFKEEPINEELYECKIINSKKGRRKFIFSEKISYKYCKRIIF